jgi:hypothetical protein
MYAPPQLTKIGDARDAVLGVDDWGFDLDSTRVIADLETAPEYPFPGGE